MVLLSWNDPITPGNSDIGRGWPCPVSAQQLLSLSVCHGSSWGAILGPESVNSWWWQAQVGCVGGGGGSMKSPVYWTLRTWEAERIEDRHTAKMVKQEERFVQITLIDDLKSHLSRCHKHPITQVLLKQHKDPNGFASRHLSQPGNEKQYTSLRALSQWDSPGFDRMRPVEKFHTFVWFGSLCSSKTNRLDNIKLLQHLIVWGRFCPKRPLRKKKEHGVLRFLFVI